MYVANCVQAHPVRRLCPSKPHDSPSFSRVLALRIALAELDDHHQLSAVSVNLHALFIVRIKDTAAPDSYGRVRVAPWLPVMARI